MTNPATQPKTVSVSVTHGFAAPPERVFDAWLAPYTASRFLFRTPSGQLITCDIDAREGGGFNIIERREGQDIEHTGRYLKLHRPGRIVFTFAVPKFSTLETKVTMTFTPEREGTTVTLAHDGVLAEYEEKTKEGWGKILDNLAKVLGE